MDRERYSRFIEGLDLRQIYLLSLSCSRQVDLEGERWLVDLTPEFQIVDSDKSEEIMVEARLRANAHHQKEQMVVVDATFMLIYHSASETKFDDEIKEVFLKNNPPLNVWPYAREVISSMTTRMGLPPLIIEPYKVY